jgi:hypothetical protein
MEIVNEKEIREMLSKLCTTLHSTHHLRRQTFIARALIIKFSHIKDIHMQRQFAPLTHSHTHVYAHMTMR